jgi:hypothetical protein
MYNGGLFVLVIQSLMDSTLVMNILFVADNEFDFFLVSFKEDITLSDVLYPKNKCRFLLPTNQSFTIKFRSTYFI